MSNLTPAQQAQVEKVRWTLAKRLAYQTLVHKDSLPELKDEDSTWLWVVNNDFLAEFLEKADSILSLEGLAILDSEQTPPKNTYLGAGDCGDPDCHNDHLEVEKRTYNLAQSDMRQANFKKVIPKGE